MLADNAASGLWDWGAVGVVIVLAGGAFRSIQRAFAATDVLDARFTDRQRRARAGLESDYIIPQLARLLVNAAERLPSWSLTQMTENELAQLMQDELQNVDYIDDMRQLGGLARDYEWIAASYDGAERWARIRGFAGILVLAALVYPGIWLAGNRGKANAVLWVSVAAGMAATACMLISWVVETRLRNRLVRLCRRYERSS